MKTSTNLLLPLFLLVTGSASAAPRSQPACLRLAAQRLSDTASCGFRSSIEYFLRELSDDDATAARLAGSVEAAFLAAGCSPDESVIEARRALDWCADPANLVAELRRRDPAGVPARAAQAAAMLMPRATDMPDAGQAQLAARATDAAASATPTSLQCSTTRTVPTTTCPIQSTGPSSGSTLPCISTVQLFARCADGLICSADLCMVAQTTLDTGGLIVTIGFAAAITLAIALLTFMCCKERSMHKRLAAKAEAAEIAKETAAAKRAKVADSQPLMSPARVGSPVSAAGGYGGADVGVGSGGGGNPFNDGNRL